MIAVHRVEPTHRLSREGRKVGGDMEEKQLDAEKLNGAIAAKLRWRYG